MNFSQLYFFRLFFYLFILLGIHIHIFIGMSNAHHPLHGPFGIVGGTPITNYPGCMEYPSSKGLYYCSTVPYPGKNTAFYEIGHDIYTGVCFVRGMSDSLSSTQRDIFIEQLRTRLHHEYGAKFISKKENGTDIYIWRKAPTTRAIAGVEEIRYYIRQSTTTLHSEVVEEYRFVNYSGCLRSIDE